MPISSRQLLDEINEELRHANRYARNGSGNFAFVMYHIEIAMSKLSELKKLIPTEEKSGANKNKDNEIK